eukprot:1136674-Pelagomonas_calceolata.AAC.2
MRDGVSLWTILPHIWSSIGWWGAYQAPVPLPGILPVSTLKFKSPGSFMQPPSSLSANFLRPYGGPSLQSINEDGLSTTFL